MATLAPERTGTTRLISLYRSHCIILRPAHDVYDERGGRRTPDRGLMLKFEGYRADATPEEMAILETLPVFTGIGAMREVWVEEDETAPMMPTAELRTVRGAVGRAPQIPQAPVSGWDQMGIAQIREVLAQGQVDPLRAGAWEQSHRNRKRVRLAIAQALMAEAGEEVLAPVDEEIPDTFGAQEEADDG